MNIHTVRNHYETVFWVLPLLGVLFVAFAVIGAIHHYSAVPYWDMWDSYINFYMHVKEGHYSEFWALHNEHRIVISKLLFWIDLRYFHGLSWFLIGVNFVLMSLLAIVFYKNAQLLFKQEWSRPMALTTAGLLMMVCFSWLQKDNITWAFQSQFFLAFLLPMLAFQNVVLSACTTNKGNRSNRYFIIATLMGIMSIGTLACGVLVLPLLTIMALVLRQSQKKIIMLLCISMVGMGLYLYDYKKPVAHGSLVQILHDSPVVFVEFFFGYFGSPLYYIANVSHIIPVIIGLFFISIWLYSIYNFIKNKKAQAHNLVFLFFILYVVLVSFLTASGRANFGLEAAFASRYTTPVLLAWISLFVLLAHQLKEYKYVYYIYAAIIAAPMMLIEPQIAALNNAFSVNHKKEVAALALTLNVHDMDSINDISPRKETIFDIANKAKRQHLSIFSRNKFKNAIDALGKMSSEYPVTQCLASIKSIKSIIGSDGVSKISGVVNADYTIPTNIFFIDTHNKIIGVAIASLKRYPFEGSHYNVAFDGYVFGTHDQMRVRCLV